MSEVSSKETSDLTKDRVSLRIHERNGFICMELGIRAIDALEIIFNTN